MRSGFLATWLALAFCAGACGSQSGSNCLDGQMTCNGQCVDMSNSDAHCGSCNNACPANQECVASVCQDTDCSDECSRQGARACDDNGQNGFQVCALDWDADTCLEWGPLNNCESFQTCVLGICEGSSPACSDDCSISDRRCAAAPANGVEVCGQFDADLCLDWGGLTTCQQGDCVDGACPGACTDECQADEDPVCEGSGYRSCGNHDADECLEWSAATDCGKDMDCEDGECCIEEGEDCEDYDECCDCYHCCPVFKECVPDWWDSDCL